MERTFVMLKPGVLQRRIAGELITRLERKGLHLIAMKLMRIPKELAQEHYGEHKGKDFYPDLVEYTTSAPVIAMVLEGDEAVMIVRKMAGSTRVENAEPGTIRGDYAFHTWRNIIHASDSTDSAQREIKLFFHHTEIIEYGDGNIGWI